MKKTILILATLMLGIMLSAQTQQGFVKTKGRMVNGKHVPGQGLRGATVSIKGRTPVLVQNGDGSFSFPIPAQTFMLQNVQKNGYELVDADALKKPYSYSTNPIYLVMETPEQQMQDQLDSERKIRRTLQRQLQQREDELETLKETHQITLEEYQQTLQKLYAEQESNEKLIAEMAKEYAQLDYDQMNDLNRRISDAILNGRLTEADSLLRSKGDMKSRVAEIRREQQAEAQREEEITQEQNDLAKAKVGTKKKLEDAAADCYKFFDLRKLNMEWDSAAYYITLRADLDTSDVDWQTDAAEFLLDQNQFQKAEYYYLRTLELYRQLAILVPLIGEPDLAMVLDNLGIIYSKTQRFTESETMYLEALDIHRKLAKDKPLVYGIDVTHTLNNLASLYASTQRLMECETIILEAIEICRQLVKSNPQAYEPSLATELSNLATLYSKTQRFEESEMVYLEALTILRRLVKDTPEQYEIEFVKTLSGLADIYAYAQGFKESEELYSEALEICRQLAQNNPQTYEGDLAQILMLYGFMYDSAERLTESETMYLEALEIYRRLAKDNPQVYEPYLASSLDIIGELYADVGRLTESEPMYLEALEIYRQLANKFPKIYEPDFFITSYNIALLYLHMDNNPIPFFEESLGYFREQVVVDSSYEINYVMCLYGLSQLYSATKEHLKCYKINEEWLPKMKSLYQEEIVLQEEYAIALGNQSFQCIFLKKFEQAEQYAREAMQIDGSKTILYTNLAASLLFQGRYAEAEAIYRQYKDELKGSFLQDFNDFEAAGVIPEERKTDVERIRKMLTED